MTRALWIAAALISSSQAALACKCAVTSRADALAHAAVAFEGEILDISTDAGRQRTKLHIVQPIKGIGPGEAIVETGIVAAACGWDFRDGDKRVTVAARRIDGNRLAASRCPLYNLNPPKL